MHSKESWSHGVVAFEIVVRIGSHVTLASRLGKKGTLLQGRGSNRTVWPVIS